MEGDVTGMSQSKLSRRRLSAHLGPSSDSVWGVIDFVPDSDFPDIHNQAVIQSPSGTVVVIGRERELVRLYITLPEGKFTDPATGRVDLARASPEMVLKEGQRIMSPYKLEVKDGQFDWWTIYVGESHH